MKQSPPKATPWANKRSTPHVRLNSSNDNILDQPNTQTPPSQSRSLTKHRRRPGSIQITGLYKQKGANSSQEHLLPPPPARHRDEELPPFSSLQSPTSDDDSKRSTWSSDPPDWNSSSPTAVMHRSPFDDPSIDDMNTQTVSEKFNISPLNAINGLLIYPEDIEKDDWLHNPDSSDSDFDNCRFWNSRGVINCAGLMLIVIGILALFIGYPIMMALKTWLGGTPQKICDRDVRCISATLPLLKNVRLGLIDPDTPKSAYKKKSVDGRTMVLVFSDEFKQNGRTFYDGDDPYWQAVDLWYGVTGDLEWYDPDALTTKDGTLNIRFDKFKNHGLEYRSGMLQSWNKMCFKGGRLEASISLPGRGDISGFWPGFWAMGNLGRPGYASTTDGLWPYSYDNICDAGITPNQSDPSGLSYLPGMRLPACTCVGEDHPSPGRSRSAPEIDAIEASVSNLDSTGKVRVGSASQSVQCAPFDVFWQPDYNFVELYDNSVTTMNSYQGSIWQQALSGVTNLNNTWYDGKFYQTYSFEYTPGKKGKVSFFVGNQKTWFMDSRAFGPNGNIGQRIMPEEPMSVIANFGLSSGFAYLDIPGLEALMPATMRIDYVRIYQEDGQESVTCDPEGYETTGYINRHIQAYMNPNITRWTDTIYHWPLNSLMHGCKAANYHG